MPRLAFAAIIAVALASCAPVTRQPQITDAQAQREAELQMEMAARRMIEFHQRAYDVYHPIRLANADQCGEKVTEVVGLNLATPSSIPKEQHPVLTRIVGSFADYPVVIGVVKDGPADRAGIKVGDKILGAGGARLTHEKIEELLKAPGASSIDISRAGSLLAVEVVRDRVCDFPIGLQAKEIVNAYADGKQIVVTSGMMEFARSDEELALVLGHELAHNTMAHIEKKRGNAMVGVVIGAILQAVTGVGGFTDIGAQVGSGAFSQEFEGEADYVGTYYTARAGYDITNAAHFWRRMGVAHPSSIHLDGSSHPSTAKRFMAIDETVREIGERRARGEPLVPELKSAPESSPLTDEES